MELIIKEEFTDTQKDYPTWLTIWVRDGHKVCEIETDKNPNHREDAKLIAAAPDLLEALEYFVYGWKKKYGEGSMDNLSEDHTVTKALEAINKATS